MKDVLKKALAVTLSAAMMFAAVPVYADSADTGKYDVTKDRDTSETYTAVEVTDDDYKPVGGLAPMEIRTVEDDVEIGAGNDGLVKYTNIFNSDPLPADSVFVKGVGTAAYNALTLDGQKTFYGRMDKVAAEFMQATTDLTVTSMGQQNGDAYVVGRIQYKDLGLTLAQACQAFCAYNYDHPAYYWISNSVWKSDEDLYLCTEPEYASVSTRASINQMIDAGVKAYAAVAVQGEDALDEIALVHNSIVMDIDYAYSSANTLQKTPETAAWAHNVQGVFDPAHKRAVCEGYADTFSLMMNYLGIPNHYIVGNATNGGAGGGHAWNAVSDDGGKTYMYMDLTWDDMGDGKYYHYYFGMPKSDFETSHMAFSPTQTVNNEMKWMYEITDTISDTFEGTYYYRGGFWCGGTVTDELVLKMYTKGARLNGCIACLAGQQDTIGAVKRKLDPQATGYSYTVLQYKGVTYYMGYLNDVDKAVGISAAVISPANPTYTYRGSAVEPVPDSVVINGVKLLRDVDYTLSYTNNTALGDSAVMTVTGKDGSRFTGSVSASFTIIEANTYAVTFKSDGSVYKAVTVMEDDTVQKPLDPAKSGYTFEGWYRDNTFTTPWNFNTDKVNADITLFAKWKKGETSDTSGKDTSGKDTSSNSPSSSVSGGGGGASSGDATEKKDTVSTNTVSTNTVSTNTVSTNTVSGNTTDGDTATGGLDMGSDAATGSGKITVSKGNVSIVYTVKGKTVTLTKVTAKGSTVKIPVTVEENGKTYKVTKIAPNAFKGNKKIKKVVIGGNVTQIGKKAFAGCSGVKKVVIDAKSLKKVGKKAFSGIPENAVIKIKGNAKQKAKAQKLISRSF